MCFIWKNGQNLVKLNFNHDGIKFVIDMKFNAIDKSPIIDTTSYKERAEDKLDSTDMMVVVSTRDDKIERIYRNLEGSRTKNISTNELEIKAPCVVDIFIYYEKYNMNNSGWHVSLGEYNGDAIELIEFKNGQNTSGYDSLYGHARVLIKKDAKNLKIPVFMDMWISGDYFQFFINIMLSMSGEDEREPEVFEDVLSSIDKYIPTNPSGEDEILTNKINIILTIITNIGIILSVLISAIVGVKYMIGSVEEKADYKKDMIPYLIGACLLFGICTFVKILQEVGNSINMSGNVS